MIDLYVRDQRGHVTPLRDALTPAGKGSAMRDRVGRVVLVGEAGQYIGLIEWQACTAWLITDHVGALIAYKNPQSQWVWKEYPADVERAVGWARETANELRAQGVVR